MNPCHSHIVNHPATVQFITDDSLYTINALFIFVYSVSLNHSEIVHVQFIEPVIYSKLHVACSKYFFSSVELTNDF